MNTESFLKAMHQNKAQCEADIAAIKTEQTTGRVKGKTYLRALEALYDKGVFSEETYELYKQISPVKLKRQYEYVIQNSKQLLDDLENKKQLRLSYKTTTLPLTFSLDLSNDNISLYLETKSNKTTNLESEDRLKLNPQEMLALKKLGASKTGKPCWKISSVPPEKYFSLVYNKELKENSAHPFKDEMEHAARFGHSIAGIESCITYKSPLDGKIKVTAYTKTAIGSLDQFIGYNGLTYPNRSLMILHYLKLQSFKYSKTYCSV